MHIQRRFTKSGQSAYAAIEFRKALSEIKNPDGSVVFRLEGFEVPEQFEPGRGRHPGAEVFPQGRRAGAPEDASRRTHVPSWLWRSVADEAALADLPEDERYRRRDRRAPGVRPARRHLDLLGLEGRLFRHRGRRARLLRRASLHAGDADGRAELAAVVQHRPALGLRHRRPRPGPLLRRLRSPAS